MGAVSVALLAFLSAAVCLTAIAVVILRLQS
jgi:hypothetical protein